MASDKSSKSLTVEFPARQAAAFGARFLGWVFLSLVAVTPRMAAAEPDSAVPVNVGSVAAGAYHSLFLERNGTLWASGRNNVGQLGDGGSRDRSRAVRIDTGVAAVAAGSYHTLILKRDGTLWGTGHNGWGSLVTADHGIAGPRCALRTTCNRWPQATHTASLSNGTAACGPLVAIPMASLAMAPRGTAVGR